MKPPASDRLIDEGLLAAVQERLRVTGRLVAEKALKHAEPQLHYALCRISMDALADLEGISEEVHGAVHDAVFRAALLSIEAYRVAHYQLWAGTVLGTVLEQLDPALARRAGKCRRKGPDAG